MQEKCSPTANYSRRFGDPTKCKRPTTFESLWPICAANWKPTLPVLGIYLRNKGLDIDWRVNEAGSLSAGPGSRSLYFLDTCQTGFDIFLMRAPLEYSACSLIPRPAARERGTHRILNLDAGAQT